ncbi:hypothetical protein SRHO_G00147530 [Serrasalmus rhombeus]
MFEGIKKALGPMQSKTARPKTSSGKVITDKAKQMERWAEHYSEVSSRENFIVTSALDTINPLLIMEELDAEPTQEELSKAINNLACSKAPGNDGIPPDLIRHCKTTLLQPLHNTLCQCWSEGGVVREVCTLYKNKGDRSDSNNYRGISLLSIMAKLYARVLLVCLQQLAERIYPESQCGFRAERSTVDMIFSLRQLQEKCREQQKPLYVTFIDLTKAFYLVSRDGLCNILLKIRCPRKLYSMIRSFHGSMKATIQYEGSMSEPFDIKSVSDGQIFPGLQRLLSTNVLGQDVDTPLVITIDNYKLEVVHQFTYLGSTISDNLSLDAKINKRIGKAATTLGRLTTCIWENPKLTTSTKMAVYNTCIISTLLYGSESWTTYAKQEQKLNSFHMQCLRCIIGISWNDKVPNAQVLARAGCPNMYTLLRQYRLRWLSHVRRMEDGQLHLRPVQQRLPLLQWNYQPPKMLF